MTLAETHPALMALGWGTAGWSELPVTLAQMTISSALPGVVGEVVRGRAQHPPARTTKELEPPRQGWAWSLPGERLLRFAAVSIFLAGRGVISASCPAPGRIPRGELTAFAGPVPAGSCTVRLWHQ